MARTKLGVVGAGNMGYAVLAGAVGSGVLAAGDVVVADPSPACRERAAGLGCSVSDDPSSVRDASTIMLAVKPQIFPDASAAIGRLEQPTVVISIMAGLGSETIRGAMGEHARVVRVMPNTPGQVGAGVSAVALGAGAAPGDDALARELLGAIGHTVDVREDQMYAVTGVSGSGPAYVFLLAEAMEAAAVDLGLEPAKARILVQETIRGAAALMIESAQEPADLRVAVTSKGGTTAAALAVMDERGLRAIIGDAITAARDRGVELDGLA